MILGFVGRNISCGESLFMLLDSNVAFPTSPGYLLSRLSEYFHPVMLDGTGIISATLIFCFYMAQLCSFSLDQLLICRAASNRRFRISNGNKVGNPEPTIKEGLHSRP